MKPLITILCIRHVCWYQDLGNPTIRKVTYEEPSENVTFTPDLIKKGSHLTSCRTVRKELNAGRCASQSCEHAGLNLTELVRSPARTLKAGSVQAIVITNLILRFFRLLRRLKLRPQRRQQRKPKPVRGRHPLARQEQVDYAGGRAFHGGKNVNSLDFPGSHQPRKPICITSKPTEI